MQVVMQPTQYLPNAQGLQTVATPLPAMITTVTPEHQVGFKPHQKRTMTILSSLQIGIGISCATIYIVLILIHRSSNNYYNGGYIDSVGAGIWCGSMYIISGSLGVAAARQNRLSLIIASMVFNILSTLFLWVVVGIASAAIDTAFRDKRQRCTNYYYFCYNYDYGGYQTADSLLIIFSIIELVISIWCSVLTCKGSCKPCCHLCCYDSNNTYQTPVIYMPTNAVGQSVMYAQHMGAANGYAMNIVPNQPFYAGMQQPVQTSHLVAPTIAPPGYQLGFSGLPAYSTIQMGNVAAGNAVSVEPRVVTQDEMAYGH